MIVQMTVILKLEMPQILKGVVMEVKIPQRTVEKVPVVILKKIF
uniref:PHD finger protein 14 n=1 Tax=Rousettus aegyptiacus TaxID=9407 RepID=A0A7J8D7I6_ROUAE|nr:PHD finger protein 14 [Rousettus aegyptiacus]